MLVSGLANELIVHPTALVQSLRVYPDVALSVIVRAGAVSDDLNDVVVEQLADLITGIIVR